MLIAQISDTHIAGWNKQAYDVAPMAENLEKTVKHINQLKLKADVTIITGDIGNTGKKEEYEQAKSILEKLDMPYFVIPGNHDSRESLFSIFGNFHCFRHHEFIQYSINDYSLRLIGVDSTALSKPGGELCGARLRWLEHQLIQDKEKPTIVFMHHPPLNLGVAESNNDGFIGALELGIILEKHNNIKRILCGHVHLPIFSQWAGTIVSTAPSIGMTLALDLTLKDDSKFTLNTPAYQLHHWTPENNLITHTVTINKKAETYPFEYISAS